MLIHRTCMPAQGAQLAPIRHPPQDHGSIIRPAGQHAPIRREGYISDTPLYALPACAAGPHPTPATRSRFYHMTHWPACPHPGEKATLIHYLYALPGCAAGPHPTPATRSRFYHRPTGQHAPIRREELRWIPHLYALQRAQLAPIRHPPQDHGSII
jgi:hypothetical protein